MDGINSQWMALLWRQPMQALYLALAIFFLIFLTAQTQQKNGVDWVLEEEVLPPYSGESAAELLAEQHTSEKAPAVLPLEAAEADATLAVVAPPPPPPPSWLEYRVRRGDTMDRILRAINSDEAMRNYLLQQKMKSYRRLQPGKVVYFQQNDSGELQKLLYKTSSDYYLTAGRDVVGNFWAKEEPPVTTRERYKRGGIIESSLFAATDAAGMSDAASSRLVQVLETQIDFYRDVRRGDSFRVIYNVERDEQGDAIAAGDIVAFEYDNKLKARPRRIRGVYYKNGKVSGYYTPKGESLQRAFLPAPLKYRRVSSRFSHRRFHPVLKRWRPHRGVDYAAPSGTPVYSTADGVVFKVDNQRGYGKVVMIKHFDIYTTVYAHLRAFKKGMRRGKRVQQGEVIGYVGQTGLATGPHLHYEFRVRGKHKNPLSEVLPKQLPPLKGEELEKFQEYSAPLFAELDSISPVRMEG